MYVSQDTFRKFLKALLINFGENILLYAKWPNSNFRNFFQVFEDFGNLKSGIYLITVVQKILFF